MRKRNKVVALILAVVIAVSNLPPVWTSAAGTAPVNPQPQTTGMRLRQTGFDETTGILTMTLEIKPSLLGNVWEDEKNRKHYEGHFVDEAYLAFQVDTLSVEPITTDGTVIDAGYGRIGFVGMDRNRVNEDTSGLLDVWKKFMNPREGTGEQYGQGFNKSMGTFVVGEDGNSAETFIENYSGYFTSNNREESGMMDCYLHLRWTPRWTNFEEVTGTDLNGDPLEPGYVKAIDLQFQCYSGDLDSEGNPVKATSADALFCNSIRLPSGVETDSPAASSGMTQEEMQALIDQFYVIHKDYLGEQDQMYLSTGVAGFRERETDLYGSFKKSWHYYAYGMEPRFTEFNNQSLDTETIQPIDANPELSYENMEKRFIVLGFEARLDNTYEFGAANTGKADFYIPSDKGEYPRYAIPYMSEMEDLEDAESRQGIWLPKAQFQDAYVPLKYHLTTYVSSTSTTKPEEEYGMDDFLHGLTWKFALREQVGGDAIALDTYYQNGSLSYTDPLGEIEGETKPTTVTLRSDAIEHTFEVRQAYISSPDSNYYGCKVQTVQETTEGLENIDREVHVTPVGLMFDFTDKTEVSYLTMEEDESGEPIKSEPEQGYAPQIRISSQAADTRSYLWLGTLGSAGGVAARRGEVYILVDYSDPAGGNYKSGNYMQVKLYKDEVRTPAYTELSIDEQYRDPEQPDNATAYLIDVAQDGPQLAMAGIAMDADMFDQYGDAMYDGNGTLRVPNIEITPTTETAQVIRENGWVNALDTRFDEDTGVYYLIYGNNQLYGANDLVGGEYEIRAVYDGVKTPAVCTLKVTKDPNRFAYMDSEVRLTSDTITTPQGLLYGEKTVEEGGEQIREIRLRVPPKVLDGNEGASKVQTVSAAFNLVELANQWRDPESGIQTGGASFDVLPDLRDPVTGEWNVSKLREYFDFSFEWNNADGTRTPITGVGTSDLIRRGQFTYTSAAGAGTHPETRGGAGDAEEGDPMYVTVKVKRLGGEEDEVQTNKYRIYFVRDNRSLTTIKARYGNSTPGKEVTANLVVPEEGKTVKAHVDFLPYDQYDEALNWSLLQSNDGQEWKMVIDRNSMRDENGNKVNSLPGVSLVDLNSSYIQLTKDAQPCSFDVYAVYGGKDTSKPETNNKLRQLVHVKVTKKPPVPARVQSITDGIIEIDVPNIEEPDKVNKGGPTIVVIDQYGNRMDPDDYVARWSFEQMPPDPRIHLDTATGVVSVESCAPAWDNITMKVKLYSKVESPVGSGNWVQGEWMRNININTTYTGLRVVRNANPDVTELKIATESLSYPAQGETRAVGLEAYATTEYGVETKLVAGDGSMWLLESVEYGDGTKAVYREPIVDEVTGEQLRDEDGNLRWSYPNPRQINYEMSGSTYYDISRRVITLERDRAQLRFGNTITNLDWAPVAVTVTCQYSNATKTVRLPISYEGKNFSEISRRPDSVTILDRISEVIQVPKSTEPDVEIKLDAAVKDQFGFIINGEGASNAPCKWEIVDPQPGVSIKDGTTLTVNSYAGNGSVTVRATYTQGEYSKSSEQPIGLGLAPSEPSVLIPLGIEEIPEAANMEAARIPLPGFAGPAQDDSGKTLNNAEQVTYTLKSKVEDGNHVHLTAQTVKWEVSEDVYNMASIANNNKLTIRCTQAWIDAGRPETVQIKLHAYDSSTAAVNADVTLTIEKQQDFGAYAMPKMITVDKWPVYTDFPGLETTHLLVPSMEKYIENGRKPYEAHFEATVYSQYREELPMWPVDITYRNPFTLEDTITGLKMTPTLNGKSVLEISPNVDVSVAHVLIVAKPNGEHGALDETVNKCDIYFDAGSSYQAGVALGTDFFNQAGDRTEDVPTWDPGEDQNLPIMDEAYAEFELKAFVHDQRGSDYEGFNVEGVYPVWKMGANCPAGVTFENPTDDPSRNNSFDADGNPYGKTVRVWVSSKALGQNETQKAFDVQVWANGHLGEGGDFEKTQKVTLIKSPSRSRHIFFKNVESTAEDGAGIGESIDRPGIGDPAVTVPVGAMVFDSYGYQRDDVATTITIKEALLPDEVTVEPLLAEKGKEVIGQRIVRDGRVMAEFVAPVNGLGNGSLTVYTPCNLDAIELELQCDRVPGTKTLRLPILQQEKYAQSAALYDGDTEKPVETSDIFFRRDTDDGITKHYYVAIFDQYGDRVSGELAKTIVPVWTVNVAGEEEGTWVEYTEVDEEGNPLPESERFLRYRDSVEAKSLTMVVEPSKYKNPLQLRVTCTLTTEGGGLLPGISTQEMTVSVRKRSSNNSSSASGAYIVTYLAGAHGSLTGNIVTETVLEGTTPKFVPDVIAEKGYAHRGWDLDGELIRDPGSLEVYSDIVLVAQYISLSDVAFVSGYEDDTVRPKADITRGEFTRMLVGALTNYDPETHAKYANPFEDVKEGRYYRDYVAYAYFYGIISGYEDGTFRPDDPITRAEAAGMIAKAKNIEPAVGVVEFTDLKAESWYTGFVEALGRLEILHGYGDGTFRPANHLTRAEAVTMLVRITETAPSERELEAIRRVAEVPFKDLDRKFWATPYILRAAGLA